MFNCTNIYEKTLVKLNNFLFDTFSFTNIQMHYYLGKKIISVKKNFLFEIFICTNV